MSEAIYVLLAMALIVAYLLLTSDHPAARASSRVQEIEQLARTTEQAMERQFQLGKQALDEAARRRQS